EGDAPVERLGAVLAERIGAVVPVLPVSLIAAVLMDVDGPMTRPELEAAAIDRAERLAAAGAHLHIPRADLAYGVEAGLRMLTLRRIVAETAGGYVADPGEGEILRFYANAIRHLSPSPSTGASAEDQASS
ncbi:MAG: glycerol-3-phosphate acyltransferase, partial [Pseudomonadota bacterium]